MKCPYCSNLNSSVNDSRNFFEKGYIRRRRECDVCHRKFTTTEEVSNLDIKVIKKSKDEHGNFIVENFSLAKVKKSIIAATGKKTKKELVERMINSSIDKVLSKKTNEIHSKDIGNIVLKEIGKVSPSAYLRFACEYMGLESLEEVKNLIEKFKK